MVLGKAIRKPKFDTKRTSRATLGPENYWAGYQLEYAARVDFLDDRRITLFSVYQIKISSRVITQ